MANPAQKLPDIEAALDAAIRGGQLPSAVMDRAVAIAARLKQSLRVSLLGMPWSGKTGVLNVLAGQPILSDTLRGATIEFEFGDIEHCWITRRDGTLLEYEGQPDFYRIGMETPAHVKFQLPIPAFRKISLLELAMPPDPENQDRAMRWVAKRTDIAIWCTDTFTEQEQSVWQKMPPAIKDHAILLRTKADLLGSDRTAALADLPESATDEFAFQLAISAQEAIHARQPDGSVDKDAMRASGGTALITTIVRQIERGRQNALDQAEYLLEQAKTMPRVDGAQTTAVIDVAPEEPNAKTAEPAPEPAEPAQPKRKPRAKTRVKTRAKAKTRAVAKKKPQATPDTPEEPQAVKSIAARLRDLQVGAEPEAETSDVASKTTAEDGAPAKVKPKRVSSANGDNTRPAESGPSAGQSDGIAESDAILARILGSTTDEFSFEGADSGEIVSETPKSARTAIDAIKGTIHPKLAEKDVLKEAVERLSAVGAMAEGVGNTVPDELFVSSINALDWVSEQLSDSETYADLRDIAMDASDTMQLVKLEAGTNSVEEAVSMMLQLKRAFKSELAQ
jgi:outer membrane biosynthesis protein TonB